MTAFLEMYAAALLALATKEAAVLAYARFLGPSPLDPHFPRAAALDADKYGYGSGSESENSHYANL